MAVKAIVTSSVKFDVAQALDEVASCFGVAKSWVVEKALEDFIGGDRSRFEQQVKAKKAKANDA